MADLAAATRPVGDMTPSIRRRTAAATTDPGLAGLHPVLQRVYAARGVCSAEQVDHRLRHLAAPDSLGGLVRATQLLAAALAAQQRIVVVGDFDADGATGTAVAVRGLRLLGACNVGFKVPNRAIHGYGLSPALVAELRGDAPALLLTVDNGVAAHAGVAAARAAGMQVIVTDHHLPGATLPDADALVDPCLPGDRFPSKALAGVGVVFYLLLALRAHLRAVDWFGTTRPEPDLSVLLDLVALGTVADLVPLDHNNRVLVAAGLRRMQAGAANAGLRALIAVSGREPAKLQAADLGFALAPRINAAGRLDDMAIGIQCLLCDDEAQALALAQRLDAINRERRVIQSDMQAQAEALVAPWLACDARALPAGVCLYDPAWHAGVVGLVASRLKDRLHRPVVALAPAEDDGAMLKGSGRSVEGFHLRDALADLAAAEPDLMERFGGHAMAAGLTLPRVNLDRFVAAFAARAERALGREPGLHLVETDGALSAQEANLELAALLAAAGPWGQGFPEPCFDGEFELRGWRVMAERHLALDLGWAACGTPVEAVHFGGYAGHGPPARLRLVYQLSIDEWRGARRLRLLVRHAEPA